MSDQSHWYLIHCKPREDTRALEHLTRQGFKCYLPMVIVERWRQGRKIKIGEPLFTRYLFIRLDETESNWYLIRSTRGVGELVRCNGRPMPVRDEIIDGIRVRLAEVKTEPYLKPGERVQITEGPFSNLEAIFVAADGEERAVLLLTMLQQQQKVIFPMRGLRKAG